MRLIEVMGNAAAVVGGALLLLNLTTLWEPQIQMSWGAVIVGLSLIIVKGIAKIYTTQEAPLSVTEDE